MALDHEQFAGYIQQQAKKIMPKEEVSERPYYINSVIMQRRCPVRADNTSLRFGQRGFSICDFPIDWLLHSHLLGPYELDLLSRLISFNEGYFFIKGGAKAGKSSTLMYLAKYCKKYLDPIDVEILKTMGLDGDLLRIPEFVRFLRIDLARYQHHLNESTDNPNSEYVKERIDQFWSDLARKVIDLTIDQFDNMKDFAEHFKRSFDLNNYDFEFEDDMSTVIKNVWSNELWDGWDDYKTDRQIRNAIYNIIEGNPSNINKFIGSLIPLLKYANDPNSDGRRRLFLLVIDNIDPHPTFFQQPIAATIRDVCSSLSWRDKKLNKNFLKIVIPVRLSTFKRRMEQLGGDFNEYEHATFYPSDIISNRLAYVFLAYNKNDFNEIEEAIPEEYINAIMLRFYAMWSHINDRKGYFKIMLDALCGTNLLHARSVFINWCICDNFPIKTAAGNVIEQCKDEILLEMAETFLQEYWESVLRTIKWYAYNYLDICDTDEVLKKKAVECAEAFNKIMSAMFRDHRITCYPSDEDKEGTRSTIAKQVRDHIVSILDGQIEDSKSSGNSRISQKHANQIGSIFARNISKEKLPLFIAIFKEMIMESMYERLEMECSEEYYDGTFYEDVATVINDWILIVLKELLEADLDVIYRRAGVRAIAQDDTPYFACIRDQAPRISRFDAGWHLLQLGGSTIKSEDRVVAENLLCSDYTGGSHAGLHILYIIKSAPNYEMALSKLIRILQGYGYDLRTQIIPTLTRFLNIKRRLIFFDVNDYERSLEGEINDAMNVVCLSSTGKNYIDNLVITPPYLQWAFQDSQRNGLANLTEKVSHVMTMLKETVEREKKQVIMIKRETSSIKEIADSVPSYYSASLDVLIRSFDHYAPALKSHLNSVESHGGDTASIVKLFGDSVRYAKNAAAQICEIFKLDFGGFVSMDEDQTIYDWQERLTWAEGAFSDMAGRSLSSDMPLWGS